MALCKDSAMSYLENAGYNVVRLPRTGIDPLGVLGRQGDNIEWLGTLEQIWTSEAQTPQPSVLADAASFAGRQTDEMKLSIGLKILEDILRSFGASVPQLRLAYRRARKIQFSFSDVKVSSIDPFVVGNFLSKGDLAHGNPWVTRYFEDENTQAFVLTEVLKSKSITVTATGEDGANVEVDVPAINEAVGANVAVSVAAERASQVTYSGQALLTFGFKAFEIGFFSGEWKVMGVKKGKVYLSDDDGIKTADPAILKPSARLDIR